MPVRVLQSICISCYQKIIIKYIASISGQGSISFMKSLNNCMYFLISIPVETESSSATVNYSTTGKGEEEEE